MICPVCQKENSNPLLQKEDLRLIKCTCCGLVQVDNLEAKFDLKHYEYYKDRINQTQEKLYNPITTKRYVSLLTRLEHFRKNNALLDIGCGEGHFLSVAKKMNWQIKGIEVAPHAARICKKFNINVECSDLLELDLQKEHYDIITMFEVLEHLIRPREYLLKVNYILRKGGILIITTPNFNCITRRVLQKEWSLIHKEHLFYYTPESIKRLINDTDYKIIEFKIKLITLPELWEFLISKNSNKTYIYNQNLREAAEKNKVLAYFKKVTNQFLNLTRLGESIECICQKI